MVEKLIIKFNEIWIKGQNRDEFIQQLINNLKNKNINATRRWDHLFIETELSKEEIISKLSKTYGISSFVFVNEINLDNQNIEQKYKIIRNETIKLLEKTDPNKEETYKIKTQRSDKTFGIKSPDLNQKLGIYIHEQGYKTHLKKYDNEINILITKHATYLYTNDMQHEALGGLPTGISGKVLCLLSGGIDSPVAATEMMKRGCETVLLHFYRTPELDEKMLNIHNKLNEFHPCKLIAINFLDFQNQIVKHVDGNNSKYRMVIYRKYMFKIAELIAKQNKCQAIVTGECIGQVASQTLENMTAISKDIDLLVIRPLITKDKYEIINKAEQIGTYELSNIPYKDCCTYLTPKHPSIKSKEKYVNNIMDKLNSEFDINSEEKLNQMLKQLEKENKKIILN